MTEADKKAAQITDSQMTINLHETTDNNIPPARIERLTITCRRASDIPMLFSRASELLESALDAGNILEAVTFTADNLGWHLKLFIFTAAVGDVQ